MIDFSSLCRCRSILSIGMDIIYDFTMKSGSRVELMSHFIIGQCGDVPESVTHALARKSDITFLHNCLLERVKSVCHPEVS